jgi:hypothetical protein
MFVAAHQQDQSLETFLSCNGAENDELPGLAALLAPVIAVRERAKCSEAAHLSVVIQDSQEPICSNELSTMKRY